MRLPGFVPHAAKLDPEKHITIAPMQPPDILVESPGKSIDAFSLGPPFAQQVEHDGTVLTSVREWRRTAGLYATGGGAPRWSRAAILCGAPRALRKRWAIPSSEAAVGSSIPIATRPIASLKKALRHRSRPCDAVIKMTGVPAGDLGHRGYLNVIWHRRVMRDYRSPTISLRATTRSVRQRVSEMKTPDCFRRRYVGARLRCAVHH